MINSVTLVSARTAVVNKEEFVCTKLNYNCLLLLKMENQKFCIFGFIT